MKRSDYISASEIGDFTYCKRGWWLKLHKLLSGPNPAMLAGAEIHDVLSNTVVKTKNSQTLLFAILIIVLALIGVVLLLLRW